MVQNLRILFFALYLSFITHYCFGADFDEGLNAYNKGDYETALQYWHPLAEKGNTKVQTILGMMY